MNVGLIGTGAISQKHAEAYRNIGFKITVCTNRSRESGCAFASKYGAEFLSSYEEVCHHPSVDFVDVCTFPDFRLQPVQQCAASHKHIQLQKPISTNLETAREIIRIAREANIIVNVVSQRRFEDTSIFLSTAIAQGCLGRILECDSYLKWYRSDEYYSRPIKGTWAAEGGGALINQGIHQIDMLRWIAGPVKEVTAEWQLGSVHKIESEDIINALVRFESGATGVIQAATAFWPGYSERFEIQGTNGSVVVEAGKLVSWDVREDGGDPAPLDTNGISGASDPMNMSLIPLERQFLNFAEAIKNNTKPLVSGEEGLAALEIVAAIYMSCRTGKKVRL
jgi:UDP-N-acetyl-2-amino-2-deoxyglucuronate dehydrogenase